MGQHDNVECTHFGCSYGMHRGKCSQRAPRPAEVAQEPKTGAEDAAEAFLVKHCTYDNFGYYLFKEKSSIRVRALLTALIREREAAARAEKNAEWCEKINSVLTSGEPAVNPTDAKYRIKDELDEVRAEAAEAAEARVRRWKRAAKRFWWLQSPQRKAYIAAVAEDMKKLG